MQRRTFGYEFKIEAVRLVRERGVSVAQAARDLDVHGTMLHRWVKQAATDPHHAFPGQGPRKPEQLEIDRLRKEVARLQAERTARRTYRTRDAALADMFDDIERFYNPARRHSTLGRLSPVEFENRARST